MQHNYKNYDLGLYLRKMRLKSGKSQAYMARVNQFDTFQYISNVERGVCKPSTAVVRSYLLYCSASLITVLDLHCKHERETLREIFHA